MEDNKDKTPRKRGLVASMIGGGRKGPEKSEEDQPKSAEENAAKPSLRQEVRRRRAEEERRRAKAREEREVRVRERAEKAEARAVAARDKAAREKTERERRDELINRRFDLLVTESGSYGTTFNSMYAARKPWKPADPKKILSFMPGTVEQMLVKVGDSVKAGDALMIFRAMKMSNRMVSPVDGRVDAVNVAEGESVPKNTVMIELS